jgi:peroxiredoxin family protein
MKGMAAGMFRKKLKGFGMEDPIGMLRDAVKGGKMKLIPCQMTMDLMGIKKEDMWDFVSEPVGAAAFLELSDDADQILVL